MDKKMTSGEIAKKMGISQKAVRLYDEKGLLKPADYSEGNYRLYDKDSILVLEKIIALKQIGFTLEEIYDNLIAGKNMNIIDSLNEQLAIMEKKKQELERIIGCIKGMLARTSGEPDWNSVAELARDIIKDQKADENHYHALSHAVEKKDWYVRIFESLNIKEDSQVLDLGCGYGKLWRNNLEQLPKGLVVDGVDLHGSWADDFWKFISEHKKELSKSANISIKWGDIENEETWGDLPWQGSYDYVIAHYLIEFISDVDTFVERVAINLSDGGMFSCNGFEISSEHLFWKQAFADMKLKTSFISEKMAREEKRHDEFKELLGRHFKKVEIVAFDNSMSYTDSQEVFEKLCIRYPEDKKYLMDNEKNIREYFDAVIMKNDEVIVTNESQFWHCIR